MRHGMSPQEAALDCLKRVARNFDNDEKRWRRSILSFYVLRKDGEYCGASLWSKQRRFAVCTEGPARHETFGLSPGAKRVIEAKSHKKDEIRQWIRLQ